MPLRIYTHALKAAETTPYLSITSAEKQSGKTRLLEILELLVARPWLTGRVTAAVLARKVDAEESTLLLDESDAAFNSDEQYAEALRGILNTGYRRGGKTSLCVGQGGNYNYRDFKTFSAKALAGLKKHPDTVADRSLPIRLQRKCKTERVERFYRREAEAEAASLKARISNWAAKHVDELSELRPALPTEVSDRAADCAEPLLAIADLLGGEWPKLARKAIIELHTGEESEDQSLGVRLLTDVRAIFSETNSDRLRSADLVSGLVAIEGAPWGDFNRGKEMTANNLARLLKPYRIHPKQVRLESGSFKGYDRDQFENAWARYLPLDGLQIETAETTTEPQGSDAGFEPAEERAVSLNSRTPNPHQTRIVSDVPDEPDSLEASLDASLQPLDVDSPTFVADALA